MNQRRSKIEVISIALVLGLVFFGIIGSGIRESQALTMQNPASPQGPGSWSETWSNLIQGNCSGTPPPGNLYLYDQNSIIRLGPSGQVWADVLPAGYSLLPNPGSNPPCVVNSLGDVYFYSGDLGSRALFSLNAQGALEWTFTPKTFTLEGIASATGPDGDLYVTGFSSCSCNQIIVALNQSAQEVWNTTVPLAVSGLSGSTLVPIVSPSGTIFVSVEGKGGLVLIALNPSNGAKLWSYNFPGSYILGPEFAPNGKMLFVWDSANLLAFAPNGTILWQAGLADPDRSIAGEFTSQMFIASNNTLLFNMEYPNILVEFNSTSGAQIWNASLNSNSPIWVTGVAPNGDLFIQQIVWSDGSVLNGSSLLCYSPNGSELWSLSAVILAPPDIGSANLLVDSEGDALVISANNTLYAISANGSIAWQAAMPVFVSTFGVDAGTPTYVWMTGSSQSALLAFDGKDYAPLSTVTSLLSFGFGTSTTSSSNASSLTSQSTSTTSTNDTVLATPPLGFHWGLIEILAVAGSLVPVVVTLVVVLRPRH